MGEPTVRRTGDGFFMRLGRAIDTFNGDDRGASGTEANKQANAAAVKPLPKKYSASGGRVVRGALGDYVTKPFEVAALMRQKAAENDRWYNNVSPKEVDGIMGKYRRFLEYAKSAQDKKEIIKKMWEDLSKVNLGLGNNEGFIKGKYPELYGCRYTKEKTNCWRGYIVEKVEYCRRPGSDELEEKSREVVRDQNCYENKDELEEERERVVQQARDLRLHPINAIKLAEDMRALAAKEDHWYNKTKQEDVDRVIDKYKPLIAETTSNQRKRQLAGAMIRELYETPTGRNLFWALSANPLYECSTGETYHRSCERSGYQVFHDRKCSVGGYSDGREEYSHSQDCVDRSMFDRDED